MLRGPRAVGSREVEAGQSVVHAQHGVLCGVLRLGRLSQQAEAEAVDDGVLGPVPAVEGRGIAARTTPER